MSDKNKNILIDLYTILGAMLILSYYMYVNGYVFFYGDSGGYVERAFNGNISHHWAMFYSFFIKVTSFKSSLIYVALAQNLLTSWLIFRLVRLLFSDPWIYRLGFIAIICFMNFTSTLPWISNMMMSDIFTGVGILSLILCFQEKWKSTPFFVVLTFFGCSVISHKSHEPILGSLMLLFTFLFVVFTFKKWKSEKKEMLWRIIVVWAIFLLSIKLVDPLINTIMANEKVKTKVTNDETSLVKTADAKYHFVWRALQRVGVYDKALDEYCPVENYKYLCDRNLMAQMGVNGYWDDLYKGDDFSDEVVDIAKKALVDPDYILPVIGEGLQRGLYMSRQYRIPLRTKRIRSSKRRASLFGKIGSDLQRYNQSRIARGKKMYREVAPIRDRNAFLLRNWVWIYLIFGGLLMFLVRKGYTIEMRNVLFILIGLLAGYYINCLLMATFGHFRNPRYPTRISWSVVLGMAILILTVFDGLMKKIIGNHVVKLNKDNYVIKMDEQQ